MTAAPATCLRRYTFKLYPNRVQEAALRDQARMCAELWNALLEMRETHYRRARQRGDKKTALTAFDQGRDITALRAALPEWAAQPRGTQERVAEMLDLAFKAFFRRAREGAGAASGYPRFKRVHDRKGEVIAESIHLREPSKSSWKFAPSKSAIGGCSPGPSAPFSDDASGESPSRTELCDKPVDAASRLGGDGRKPGVGGSICPGAANSGAASKPDAWRLTMRGVPGAIKVRGRFPATPLAFKTADIRYELLDDSKRRRRGCWWFSVCVEMPARRIVGAQNVKVALDLIDQFAVVETADGQCLPGFSDPFQTGRTSESPLENDGLRSGPRGDSANVGEAAVGSESTVRGWTRGDSANVGEAAGMLAVRWRSAARGDSANVGEAAGKSWQALCKPARGDSANVGEAAGTIIAPSERPPRGDSANVGEAAGARGRSSSTRGDSANVGERQDCASAFTLLPNRRHFKRGSIRWRREKCLAGNRQAQAKRARREALHRWSTSLARVALAIEIIAPPKQALTSGRGDADRPGAQVETIAALNRRVLGQAPAAAIQMLEYKCAESGAPCAVTRREDHPIRVGGDLRSAAVAVRRATRLAKRRQKDQAYV